ncbi:MAG: DMT family protein [Planctomycetia bacterium]|nr:DMT family protein [Planctomycetia bacterium]
MMVLSNRVGDLHMNLGQLKILQEVDTPCIFVRLSLLDMKSHLSWNFAWAELRRCGAVYFVCRYFPSPEICLFAAHDKSV